MTLIRSTFLRTALERGYIYQCSNLEGLDSVLSKPEPVSAYVGFDCTADSLHVGHLMQIMLLRRLQQSGHRPVILIGGGTTQIGDPSGKEEARPLLSQEEIAANIAGIQEVFSRFLVFGQGSNDALMLNNASWLESLNYVKFLRSYGRYFSVRRMLSFDSVRKRLEREQPLTFLEFNYMVLQSYDFLELWRQTGCRLQIGGSDQWGNIIGGIELTQKISEVELFGLTSPLLLTASGKKMGKTASGAIWLNSSRLSAYNYWQFWRNTDDADTIRFLRLFTDLPLEMINRLSSLTGADFNKAKKILAFEATRLAHGEKVASAAAESSRRVFEEKLLDNAMPTLEISRTSFSRDDSIGLLDVLKQAGLVHSNSEARRLVSGKGVRINDTVVTDVTRRLTKDDFKSDMIKLSAGRKRHILVRRIVSS